MKKYLLYFVVLTVVGLFLFLKAKEPDFLYVSVTVEVEKSDSTSPAGTLVTLTALEWPWTIHIDTIKEGHTNVVFDSVFKACYKVEAECYLYHPQDIDSICFETDSTVFFLIQEETWPPRNLYVDPLTSIASWDTPCIKVLLLEDFEDETFPPEGWQAQGGDDGMDPGWLRMDSSWKVPPGDGFYARSECPLMGSVFVGRLDYLITPVLDLSEENDYTLMFDSYYSDEISQHRTYIRYSFDAGETWNFVHQLEANEEWVYSEIDLSSIPHEGRDNTWLAFHSYITSSYDASFWAVDNVSVSSCPKKDWPYHSYNVKLNDIFLDTTNKESYYYPNLVYGTTYVSSVQAVYTTQPSEEIFYTFTSTYLIPPSNLELTDNQGTVQWLPPRDTSGLIPGHLLGFNEYVNGILYRYIPYEGADTIIDLMHESGLLPGTYEFAVSAVYDIEPYGFPGDTSESLILNPITIPISYGLTAPFIEDWQSGTFTYNNWEFECENWQIHQTKGNPAPSSSFRRNPIYNSDYSCPLISQPVNARYFLGGDIILSFDLKLESYNIMNSNEKIDVKLWENGNWHQLFRIYNKGSFDWTNHTFDITSKILDTDFRVGFFVEGDHSSEFEAWYIDNIKIDLDCYPALYLNIDDEQNNNGELLLSWINPDQTYGSWESHHDNDFELRYAPSQGGIGLAQQFVPNHYPAIITKVRFLLGSLTNSVNPIDVYILNEEGSEILSGPVRVENLQNEDWVEVNVKDVVIDSGGFMVATINQSAYGPYIATDYHNYNGTLYIGSIGNFTEVGELGKHYVGSHEAYLEYEYSENSWIGPGNNVEGFNVFRAESGVSDFQKINDVIITDTFYTDVVQGSGNWCYYVSTVYDLCESNASDTICADIINTQITDSISTNLNIYPNPCTDKIFIESNEPIDQIEVIDLQGRRMKIGSDAISSRQTAEVNLEGLRNGIYLVKVYNSNGIEIRKIIKNN